jgi:hypothetical protein
MDESSDILGGQLNVAHEDHPFPWPAFTFSGLILYGAVAIASIYGLQLLYPYYRQFQERRYRKSVYSTIYAEILFLMALTGL